MRSHSETSYGARIGNAEKLVAALQNFNGYLPIKPEFSITSYTGLINTTKGFNTTVADKKQAHSLAVENRIQIFDKREDAIKKTLPSINGAVKVFFGRTSKEAKDVAAIIAKITGNNIKRGTINVNENLVSQSYQSYQSKTQFFADLVEYLTNFGTDYDPANSAIKVIALNGIYANAVTANNEVMNTFTQFAQNNAIRIESYNQLSQTAIRIKDSVKAQYGVQSTEYRLIKGLKI
ncbi:hypothetical protein [Flavobacterium wongokense]|uniref:hypothetical protein n=1 Tax=Flavobacterium wongokense TaxID=2910674 RepID=UPI001F22CF58|nr:hypothetical protein [Flavobacterium sp. WG47]MCF6132857.1 hypothetical protein [Flavobacterium sp. WG47]